MSVGVAFVSGENLPKEKDRQRCNAIDGYQKCSLLVPMRKIPLAHPCGIASCSGHDDGFAAGDAIEVVRGIGSRGQRSSWSCHTLPIYLYIDSTTDACGIIYSRKTWVAYSRGCRTRPNLPEQSGRHTRHHLELPRTTLLSDRAISRQVSWMSAVSPRR